jgi:glycerophosphoryl diester phosphodiesterase
MSGGARVTTIAHAYGNSRRTLRRALAAPIDMLEADVWYRAGDVHVRHERRLGPLPILIDRRSVAAHTLGAVLSLPRGYYLRPDLCGLTLSGLLRLTAGRKALLLDVKPARDADIDAFAAGIAHQVQAHDAAAWVQVCGQYWPVLDRLQQTAPEIIVRYSMERAYQWERFLRLLAEGKPPGRVCIQHAFWTKERAHVLRACGISVYCWTVDDPGAARALIERGADGIISNDLALLTGLAGL